MNTINKAFNQHWEHLARIFPAAHLPSGESLDLRRRPKLNQKEWTAFISAFLEVTGIGLRNGWVHIHVGFSGTGRMLYVPDEISNGQRTS
jgi:hypothetical protein